MMKNCFQETIILLSSFAATVQIAHAQEKPEISIGADIVSGYIWRGQELGDFSVQPSASLSWKGFSLSAWGSASIGSGYAKEFDLTLGYSAGGFSVSLTDYSFSKGTNLKTGNAIHGNYFHYGSNSTLHVFEAQIGYDFDFMSINWYTNIAGNDGRRSNGRRAYSSYISVSAPFRTGDIGWNATIGATPWETSFYNNGCDGFEVSEISLQASKTIHITERFGLPLSAKAIWNPATENAYFTVGLIL